MSLRLSSLEVVFHIFKTLNIIWALLNLTFQCYKASWADFLLIHYYSGGSEDGRLEVSKISLTQPSWAGTGGELGKSLKGDKQGILKGDKQGILSELIDLYLTKLDLKIFTAESVKLLWDIEPWSNLLQLMSNRLDDLSIRSSSLPPIYSVSVAIKLSTFVSEYLSYCRDFTQWRSVKVKTALFSEETQLRFCSGGGFTE